MSDIEVGATLLAMPNHRLKTLFVLLCLALVACGGTARHPNIVLVIGDDHGWRDFGFMNSPFAKTPNLDALAAEGAVFESGYVSAAVCRPSLRTLLTGLEPFQWDLRVAALEAQGVTHRPDQWVEEFETLPSLLSQAGYATMQAGKEWEGETYGAAGFTHGLRARWNGTPLDDVSLAILRTTGAEPLDAFVSSVGTSPFFIWLAPLLPHAPHDAPARFVEMYRGAEISEPMRQYLANVTRFDEGLGRVLDLLRERGKLDDTLVLYLSDNGWSTDRDRGKSSLYDSGYRTPVIVHWPAAIAPARDATSVVAAADVFATLLDYAGVPLPPGRAGLSLRPVLEHGAAWPRDAVFGRKDFLHGRPWRGEGPIVGGGRFARTERWHYILRVDGREELYDVVEDPDERANRIEQDPQVAAELRTRLEAWEADHVRAVETLPRITSR